MWADCEKDLQRFLDAHQVGDIVQYNSFALMPIDKNFNDRFKDGIKLTINPKAGGKIWERSKDLDQLWELSKTPEQTEALFGRKARFKVDGRGVSRWHSGDAVSICLVEISEKVDIPAFHIFDAIPGNIKITVTPPMSIEEETQMREAFVDRCTAEVSWTKEEREAYAAFIEEHGLTPAEVIELSEPAIYAEMSERSGRPLLMTPARICEFIREYGEHPEIYVARVFKKEYPRDPW